MKEAGNRVEELRVYKVGEEGLEVLALANEQKEGVDGGTRPLAGVPDLELGEVVGPVGEGERYPDVVGISRDQYSGGLRRFREEAFDESQRPEAQLRSTLNIDDEGVEIEGELEGTVQECALRSAELEPDGTSEAEVLEACNDCRGQLASSAEMESPTCLEKMHYRARRRSDC